MPTRVNPVGSVGKKPEGGTATTARSWKGKVRMEVGVDEPEWNTSTRVVGASPTLDEGTRSMTASCSSVGWGESRSIDVELWYRQRTTKTVSGNQMRGWRKPHSSGRPSPTREHPAAPIQPDIDRSSRQNARLTLQCNQGKSGPDREHSCLAHRRQHEIPLTRRVGSHLGTTTHRSGLRCGNGVLSERPRTL